MRKAGASFCLAVGLVLSLGANIYLVMFSLPPVWPINEQDKGFIKRTILIESVWQHGSVEDTIRLTDSSIVHFINETCVELHNAPGVVGGKTVTCFDEKSGEVTKRKKIGQ